MAGDENFEKVSLSNLAGGAAVERFDAELERVLENISSPETKIKKARKITLEVSIVPSADRSLGAISINCTSKLVGMEVFEHSVELVQEGRRQVAYQRKGRQGKLFDDDNVTPIESKQK